MDQAMAFPRYDTYQDSGTDWLSKIPSDWSLETIRAVTQLKSEKNQPDMQVLSVYREYGVIPKDSRDDNHNATSLDTSGYKVVNEGDLVVNKMKAWQGSMGVSEHNGIVSPAYITCRVNAERVYPKFLHYLLRSQPYIGVYNALSYGVRVGQWDMHYEDFKHIPLSLPDRTRQERIANFLDQKAAEIDEAIVKKQRLIELLKEQKTILINRAVTKGLNPDVPMRDSGVEWIGVVPEHWDVKRLRFIGTTQNGISAGADYFGSGFPFVSYSDVYNNRELPNTVKGLAKSSIQDRVQYSVEKGDVLYTRTSETVEEIGFTSTCMETIENSTFAGFLIRFRPQKGRLFTGYSKYYFSAQLHRSYFVGEMNLVIRASLSQELLKNLPVLIPPLKEQESIFEYLETESDKIDNVIALQQEQIDRLKEYKVILISEAVTGKIKI